MLIGIATTEDAIVTAVQVQTETVARPFKFLRGRSEYRPGNVS